jgi:hypothetical protein
MLIYQAKERSLISGTFVAMAAGALTLRLLVLDGTHSPKVNLYAIVGAAAMAELLWPLNYWILGTVAGGLALMLAFYVLVGLMRQLLEGDLGQAVLLEYGTVAAAGTLLVFGASRL